MTVLDVELLPMLSDNYVYLLRDTATGTSGVVDPALAEPVIARLDALGRSLDLILVTHHHGDHTGGVAALKKRYGCRVVGPRAEQAKIPAIDVAVCEGDEVTLGDTRFAVLDTPGHTNGHVSYWCPAGEAVFCADTLFALGCGRLLEGTPATMWQSLGKLMALPDATRVYCGHEYTQSNARFSLTVDPDNAALAKRAAGIDALRAAGTPTVPSTIGQERTTNPFVRAGDPGIRHTLGLETADDVTVFAAIRARKDRF